MKVKLGDKVKDLITGAQGIVTSHTQWLTGCDSYGITPQELREGKPVDAIHVDESRIKVLKSGAFDLTSQDTGGPRPMPGRGR